jgi:hypothetical protein
LKRDKKGIKPENESALLFLSQSADFSSPLPFKASFGVRLYVSIVWVSQ